MNRTTNFMALALLLTTGSLVAQDPAQPKVIPIAPLPAQLATAKTVFISNAGEQDNIDCLRVYNEFYAGVAALGHLTPVLNPADADLVLELHYVYQLGRVSGGGGTAASQMAREFRLTLIDPKTHVALWTTVEAENAARLQSNRDKNLDAAIAALVVDLDKLTGSKPAPPDQREKQRIK